MSDAPAQTPTMSGPALHITRNDYGAIRVPNLEETIGWYREKLGFEESVRLEAPHLGDGVQLAFLELGGAKLEMIGGGDPERLTRPPESIQDADLHRGQQSSLPQGRRRGSGRGGAQAVRSRGVSRAYRELQDRLLQRPQRHSDRARSVSLIQIRKVPARCRPS